MGTSPNVVLLELYWGSLFVRRRGTHTEVRTEPRAKSGTIEQHTLHTRCSAALNLAGPFLSSQRRRMVEKERNSEGRATQKAGQLRST